MMMILSSSIAICLWIQVYLMANVQIAERDNETLKYETLKIRIKVDEESELVSNFLPFSICCRTPTRKKKFVRNFFVLGGG
jgi:hypothetical protein